MKYGICDEKQEDCKYKDSNIYNKSTLLIKTKKMSYNVIIELNINSYINTCEKLVFLRFYFQDDKTKRVITSVYYSFFQERLIDKELDLNLEKILSREKIDIESELREHLTQYVKEKYKGLMYHKIFLQSGV
jgi:uncharacterized membrane-anchored protein YjiN (DUF445 family)